MFKLFFIFILWAPNLFAEEIFSQTLTCFCDFAISAKTNTKEISYKPGKSVIHLPDIEYISFTQGDTEVAGAHLKNKIIFTAKNKKFFVVSEDGRWTIKPKDLNSLLKCTCALE